MLRFLSKAFYSLFVTVLLSQLCLAEEDNWTKVLNGFNYHSMENTPYGVLVGEFSSRSEGSLHMSKDYGQNWNNIGLNKRGIVDIKYANGAIFASTYYVQDGTNGLFVSHDKGNTWKHIGNNYSSSYLDVYKDNILIGTYSNGLWKSPDRGNTWVQVIGSGWFGPKIELVKLFDNTAFAATSSKLYKSSDSGNSWTEVPFFNGKTIKCAEITKDYIILGTSGMGIYISNNAGVSWNQIPSTENKSCTSSNTFFNNIFFSLKSTDNMFNTVYALYPDSLELINMGISRPYTTTEIETLYGDPRYIFAVYKNDGVYRTPFTRTVQEDRFLNAPWTTKTSTELIDKITAFFDHQYPLLGYPYHKEQTDIRDTTLNFWGIVGTEPSMYYSSHDGIDFALPYGTEVKAPASGIATYYYCDACGHTIKIDHLNGYQTTYMHLQKSDLIVTNTESSVFVEFGYTIGKVGMTGNTSGPHLHFAVLKDLNNNGDFDDDIPQGRVDPFGWQNDRTADAWAGYSWSDVRGLHQGVLSTYLWLQTLPISKKTITSEFDTIEQENIKLETQIDTSLLPILIEVLPYAKPKLLFSQDYLQYVEYTSKLINTLNSVGEKLETANNNIKITYSISEPFLRNILRDTLSVYSLDNSSQLWNPIASIFNEDSYTLEAEVSEGSVIAVFGEKLDPFPPITHVFLEGTLENNWYTHAPIVRFNVSEGSNFTTFYTLDNELNWLEYEEPFTIENEGIITLKFRSIDEYENLENTQAYVIKVDTIGMWKKNIKVVNSMLNTN